MSEASWASDAAEAAVALISADVLGDIEGASAIIEGLDPVEVRLTLLTLANMAARLMEEYLPEGVTLEWLVRERGVVWAQLRADARRAQWGS